MPTAAAQVADSAPPVVTVPETITATADSRRTAVVTFAAWSGDDVDGPLTADCDWISSSAFSVGETLVTCRAIAAVGNSGEASFVVVVNPAPDTTTAEDSAITFTQTDRKGNDTDGDNTQA
jgi:hypothetical protein